MPWFFADSARVQVGLCLLAEAEARHARASRRLQVGDAAAVFDGLGLVGQGRVAGVGRSSVELLIERVERQSKPAPALTLAVAAPKGARQEVLVEKCTELGVAALWPLVCCRSVVRPAASHVSKWRRTTVEACKQSHRAWLPEVEAPLGLEEIVSRAASFTQCWIAEPEGSAVPGPVGRDACVLALVGPEGGLTCSEIEQAERAGFQRIALGRAVLRVETAAIAIAARLNIDHHS